MSSFFINNTDSFIALGWTLLHSLWQALLVYGLVVALLRLVPEHRASVRYALTSAGMLLIFVTSIATYFMVNRREAPATITQANVVFFQQISYTPHNVQADVSLLESLQRSVEANMPLILMIWAVGALVFSMRIATGWLYLRRLRAKATAPDLDWLEKLQHLAVGLGIQRNVQLAQSEEVTVPMVIGYLKPMILVPVSMFSELSGAQVEAILTHELAHIRQNDFLINVFQTILESIFFFNPFVWLLSAAVRREREYCCDDEVLRTEQNAMIYARALAGLEEIRLRRHVLGLSLAQEKGQLLNRIQRIMERSAKEYSMKQRVVPALLLVVGLVCASWLTIQKDDAHANESSPASVLDTLKPSKSASRSRTTIITFDENGKAHEQIFEAYSGDDDARDFAWDAPFDFSIPMAPPAMTFAPSGVPFPDVPGFPSIPMPDGFVYDSLPGGFGRIQNGDWEQFSTAFEERFREQFSDFMQKHGDEFDKMMKDLEQEFETSGIDAARALMREDIRSHEQLAEQLADQQRGMDEMQRAQELQVLSMQADQLAGLDSMHSLLELRISEDLAFRAGQTRREAFERAFGELLLKDGYFEKGEKIRSFKREANGSIEVNGKKIKSADQERYNEVYEQYFRPGYLYWNVE